MEIRYNSANISSEDISNHKSMNGNNLLQNKSHWYPRIVKAGKIEGNLKSMDGHLSHEAPS